MSYLSFPRINFGGRFFTDPSTVNNDPSHYEVNNTMPSPWQNPKGLHRFQLQDCTIRSVIGAGGQVSDPLMGLSILTTDNPTAAKIVDIDVYQQGVPTIYGMQVSIPLPDGKSFLGGVDPAVLNQLWWLAVLATRSWEDSDYAQDSFGGDMNACGFYQTIIRVKIADWPAAGISPVLDQLKAKTIQENGFYLLSMRFVVDGYRNVPEDRQYQTGRIIGSIGPVYIDEPKYNPGVRLLQGRPQDRTNPWYFPTFNSCPFFLDKERKMLVIDLANGICRQTAGGGPVDLGTLTAWVNPLNSPAVSIGTVDYSDFCVENNSHIAELPLSDDLIRLVEGNGIKLTTSRNDIGNVEIFKEDPQAVNIEVEIRPVRMSGNTGNSATTRAFVSRLGKPLAGKQLQVEVVSVHGNTPGATVPPSNPGNTPQADGALAAEVFTTDENGFATIGLKVLKDPGFRTPQLDGQLYFVNLFDPDRPKPAAVSQSAMVSCLVWSAYQVNENPAWEEIQDLLRGYVKLFPGMTEKLNLLDFKSFEVFSLNPPWDHGYGVTTPGPLGIKAGAISFYLSLDITDTRYMPLTRDMSPERLMTILHFIKNLQTGKSTSISNTPAL